MTNFEDWVSQYCLYKTCILKVHLCFDCLWFFVVCSVYMVIHLFMNTGPQTERTINVSNCLWEHITYSLCCHKGLYMKWYFY